MLFYKIAFLFLLGAFVVLGESWEYSNATSMTGIFRGIIEGLTATDDGNFLLCSKYWMVKATPDLQTVIETQKGMIPEDLLKEGFDFCLFRVQSFILPVFLCHIIKLDMTILAILISWMV